MGVSAHPYKKKDKNQINTNKIMKTELFDIFTPQQLQAIKDAIICNSQDLF